MEQSPEGGCLVENLKQGGDRTEQIRFSEKRDLLGPLPKVGKT
jgi:hypothetical protein